MNGLNGMQRVVQEAFGRVVNRLLWAGLGSAIAVLLVIWLSMTMLTSSAFRSLTEAEVRNLLVSGAQNASELTSATTTIKATVVLKQTAKALGFAIGETNLVYEGVGVVRAGISLDALQIESFNLNQHKIQLLLPSPQIVDISLDVDRSSTLANYRRWFGAKAGAELYEAAQQKAIAEIKTQACSNQILEVASQNTEQIVEKILSKAGFETIQVKTQTPQFKGCIKA
jgi:hypothetical protein